MVIVTGLIAVLIAYAAVQDSGGGWEGTVGPMTWNLSRSWASSVAAVIALTFLIGSPEGGEDMIFVFAALLVFSPLIYHGLAGDDGASKMIFFVSAALITWATLGLLVFAAVAVPNVIHGVSIVPRLVLNSAMILAIVAAIMNASRGLAAGASSGAEGWTLP